jgi:hypothetical protein
MSQELRGGGGNTTTSFTTGQVCPKTALYKSTDGKIEFTELITMNSLFPPFPGGTGTKKGTWTRLSLAVDGAKTGVNAVKVEAGTL